MLNDIEWQQPWWLLLAMVPLLSWLLPRRDQSTQLEQFIARHLWSRLLTGFRDHPQKKINYHFMLAWLLACIALAGPTLQSRQHNVALKNQANIAIVLDISPSMRVQDVAPNRLAYSRQLLIELAQQLKGQRVALIAFSANAYTVLPLTTDNNVLMQMIEAMDPSLASVTGSNLSRALQLAQQTLSISADGETKAHDGVVLLISDGEIHDRGALAASRQLNQGGHRLYTFGVGTETGGPVPFATGRLIADGSELVTSRLQRSTLRALAQAGGGDYADLRPEAWSAIMKAVEKFKQPLRSERHRNSDIQLFPLFLALALIFFVWSGVRRAEALVLLLCVPLFIYSQPSEAAPWDEARGARLLEQEENKEALALYSQIKSYNGDIGSGVAAYRLGQWRPALDSFDRAMTLAKSDEERALASYNRGNTLVQLGQLEEASSAYKSTLFWQPGHPKANHNLTLLQRNQPKGGERKGKSEYQRLGEGGEEEQNRPGNSDKHAKTIQTNGAEAKKQQALQQSLNQWDQRHATNGQTAAQIQQQLNTLKEDYQTMLKQRFATEDVNDAAGLVVERPW